MLTSQFNLSHLCFCLSVCSSNVLIFGEISLTFLKKEKTISAGFIRRFSPNPVKLNLQLSDSLAVMLKPQRGFLDLCQQLQAVTHKSDAASTAWPVAGSARISISLVNPCKVQ